MLGAAGFIPSTIFHTISILFHQNSPFLGGQETRPIIPLPPKHQPEARGIEQAAQITDQGAGNLGAFRLAREKSAATIRLGWIPGSWIPEGFVVVFVSKMFK